MLGMGQWQHAAKREAGGSLTLATQGTATSLKGKPLYITACRFAFPPSQHLGSAARDIKIHRKAEKTAANHLHSDVQPLDLRFPCKPRRKRNNRRGWYSDTVSRGGLMAHERDWLKSSTATYQCSLRWTCSQFCFMYSSNCW